MTKDAEYSFVVINHLSTAASAQVQLTRKRCYTFRTVFLFFKKSVFSSKSHTEDRSRDLTARSWITLCMQRDVTGKQRQSLQSRFRSSQPNLRYLDQSVEYITGKLKVLVLLWDFYQEKHGVMLFFCAGFKVNGKALWAIKVFQNFL